MFTARSIDTNAWITSIDPEWQGREEELRECARAGRVVCPGCGQLLHFRFQQQQKDEVRRRPHFAHRAKSECPLENQSAEAMEAKALLYEWLQSKFPGDVVMDWPVEMAGWDRPADVYVKTGRKRPLAYWVFDRGVRDRCAFVQRVARHEDGFACQVVWTGATMAFHESGELKLTPTQRDLMSHGDYDNPHGGGSLTFLDAGTGVITSFRGLHLTHSPNLHRWSLRREGTLSTAKVDPNSGEILFQEDLDALRDWKVEEQRRQEEEKLRQEKERQRKAEQEKKWAEAARRLQPLGELMGMPIKEPRSPTRTSEPSHSGHHSYPPPRPPEPSMEWAVLRQELECERCGRVTTDWVSATPSGGTCVCRACMGRGA